MTIGSTSSANVYYTRAIQSTQGRSKDTTSSTVDSSSSTNSGDSIEISSEAYALYNASKSQGAPPPPPPPSSSGSGSNFSDILDSLVNDGTITSDQASTIASALAPSKKNDESSGSSDDNNPLKVAFDNLVSDGTITSDQLSSILSAFATSYQ